LELYKQLRPTEFEHVFGQEQAVSVLKTKLKEDSIPSVVMMTGSSGTGKSTCAHILAAKLGASEKSKTLSVVNCADVRGIDSVREIQREVPVKPLTGSYRIWIMEEVVQLPKATQQCFLTVLESLPPHVKIFLCTSDTSGLLPTFMSRCFQIVFKPLDLIALRATLLRAVTSLPDNSHKPTGPVMEAICQRSNGSARMALQLLEAVITQQGEKAQLATVMVSSAEYEKKIDFLAKLLLSRASWGEIQATTRQIETKDLEGLRRQVLGYMTKVLQNNKGDSNEANMAYAAIQAFRDNWRDCDAAGLMAALYEIYNHEK
jgi:DNA polymerase III subunit gamma/tau